MTDDRYYIFGGTHVRVQADTLEGAHRLMENVWPDDGSWAEIGEGVEVFAPSEEPVEIVEPFEPECICPPDLVERGGFRGGCPVHA